MTKERFHMIRNAAQELLRLRDAGAEVAADMLEWATGLLATNATMPVPFKGSPNHDKISELLKGGPPEGLTSRRVAELAEMDTRKGCVTLNYMVRTGKAFMLVRHKDSRFFATAEALEAGKVLLAQPKPLAWSARNKPKPTAQQKMQVKNRNFDYSAPSSVRLKPTIDESIFNPHGIKAQVIPTPVDNRFNAEPGSEGAGFSSEWRRLRGLQD